MSNRLIWELASDFKTIQAKDNKCQFSFELSRVKNSKSREEKLVIKCFDDGEYNGEVSTNLIDLQKDIKEFLKYGVALNSTVYDDIVQTIKDNYLGVERTIVAENVNSVNDSVISGIVKMVKDYVSQEYEKTEKELSFTTKEFEEFLSDSDYATYNIVEIRKKLAEGGYILVQGGRTSKLVREGGKIVRKVCFDLDKVRKAKV